MVQRTQGFAGMFIILLLSVHPLQAKRTRDMQDTFQSYEAGQELMNELQSALHEEMQTEREESEEAYIGEWFATCNQRKEDFERRSGKVNARYDEAMADGHLDLSEGAWVLLKARTLVNTLKKAEDKGCEWTTAKSVDKTQLESLVGKLTEGDQCTAEAKAKLEAVGDGTQQEQEDALKSVMAMLLSKDCKQDMVEKDPEASAEVMAEEVDSGSDELAEAAHDREKAINQEAKKKWGLLKGIALMEKEGFQTKELESLLVKPADTGMDASAFMEILSQTQNPLAEAFGKLLGFIILCIVWALFCWVVLAIFMFIWGLIMCIIKMIIVAFLRLFRSESWDWDFGGCMGFWMSALGHSSSGGDVGIALCAASMMSGRR